MNDNATILIVDDDLAGRESLKGVLLSQGYDLIEAENGRQAIELAKDTIPDLILLDVMMPEMDGFEVCRHLRSDPLLAEIPIILITALDDRNSRLAGIEAGADDFISKPYDRVELRARVRTVTRLNRYRRLVLERARFVWVIENDRDGYLILDENGVINYANAAAQVLFGIRQEEGGEDKNLGLFIEKVQQNYLPVPPKQWEAWPSIENPEIPLYMIRQPENTQDAQSNPVWYELRLLDLPWLSKHQRLVRVQEITDRVSLRLETWSFQSAINHKLVTPLSNILLSLQVMKVLTQKQDNEDLLDCVKTVETGFRRLESEIKDILQYVNAPNIAQSGGLFCLADLKDTAEQIANEQVIERVEYRFEPAVSLQKHLAISSRAMQVVLWEILENAKKFHPRLNPQIVISLADHPSGMAILRIADDGISLPPQDLTNALKPYYQGEVIFTGEVTGMGLGLPTVAALVWQVGGDIDLYNRPDGAGLIVELRLPYYSLE